MALSDANVCRAIMGMGHATPQYFPTPPVAGTWDSASAAAMMCLPYFDLPLLIQGLLDATIELLPCLGGNIDLEGKLGSEPELLPRLNADVGLGR